MKRTIKILLWLISVVTLLMFAACTKPNNTPTPSVATPDETTSNEPTTDVHTHTTVIDPPVAPTCSTTGLTEGKHCSVCNEILVAQTTLDALEHSYSSTITPPTATKDGYETYTCSTCGDIYTEAIIPTDFTITEDNRANVGYTGTDGEALQIPAVFQNDGTWYRVTTIGLGAFYNCYNLTSVTIPDSVTSIGDGAFALCNNITNLTIGNSVTSIGDTAFYSCHSLTSVAIPDSVINIGDGVFHNSKNLASITVGENNTRYQSIDGNLYSKDGTVLLAYAIAKTDTSFIIPDFVTTVSNNAFYHSQNLTSITIGNSVTSIGKWAFYHCSKLTNVTIPNSITRIDDSTFYQCAKLANVTIPNSVTSIGDSVFRYCSKLTSITFEGTATQWNTVEKSDNWNAFTGEYTIYCTDGTIAKDGTVTLS